MLLGLAMVLVAVVGLCQVSGLLRGPGPMPSPTPSLPPTAAPLPSATVTVTATPVPSPTPEPQVAVGALVTVSGTEGQQLRLRSGPGLAQETLRILEEGAEMSVLEGPEPADGSQWWKVKTEDGQTGWVAGDWLLPVGP